MKIEDTNILEWLAEWYKSNCNGEWEHEFGIKIDTIDNPGWSFEADLIGTKQEGKELNVEVRLNEEDWFNIYSDGEVFNAFGDPNKLIFLISSFKEFIEEVSNR